jgi:hypothetical protein
MAAAPPSKGSEELQFDSQKINGPRRVFLLTFFGEPAILFVSEAMTLLVKARRAIYRVGGVVGGVKGIAHAASVPDLRRQRNGGIGMERRACRL